MYFEFYVPTKVISGDDAVFKLPFELEELDVRRPLIITDRGIIDAGILKKLKKAFDEYSTELPPVFDDVPPETSVESVKNAYYAFKNNGCDGLLAIGGGSVIDTAKAVRIMLAEDTDDILSLVGADNISKSNLHFIAVPTTAGTGSEVTNVAVIYDSKTQSKLAFSSYNFIPDIALLDPDLTLTLPKRLTASSGIDALSHAIEGFIGIQQNPISKALSFRAVSMIFDNLLLAIDNGKDKKARFNMLNASVIAGMAFSNSMVGIVHSLAHSAGAVLHIPHGVAISLFLKAGLEINFDSCRGEFSELLKAVRCDFVGDEAERAREFLNIVGGFLDEIRRRADLPMGLKDVGFKSEFEDKIVELALTDGSSIFSKVELTEDLARRMIAESF